MRTNEKKIIRKNNNEITIKIYINVNFKNQKLTNWIRLVLQLISSSQENFLYKLLEQG